MLLRREPENVLKMNIPMNIQIGEETRKNIFGFLLFGFTYSPVLEI